MTRTIFRGLCASLLFTWGALAQTPLPTSWNFSTPVITSPPNGWTVNNALNGTGGLTYTGAGFSVGGDNIACRLDATGEFVKVWFADKPGPVSYYIKGSGIGAVSFTGKFNIQQSADDITYTNLRQFTTANPVPGGNISANKFTENPLPTTRYIRFFYEEKLSGTNVALDSVKINPAPPSPAPSITVKVGSNVIVNQTTYTIGTTASTSFTIQNNGTAESLTIDSVRISGDASADYSTPNVPASVGPNASQPLAVNFSTSSQGSRKATLKIYNNDPEKNPYVIQLYGIGGTLATEPTAAPAGLSATNATSYGFKIGLTAPASAPEKYLIIQKKGGAVSQGPSDGTAYKKGDKIGDGVVAYVGDSIVTNFRPRYIFANSTYFLEAYSFNGPTGFENYLTTSTAATSVTTLGKQPGNYYNGINPNVTSFVSNLRDKINTHDTVFYSQYGPRLLEGYIARDTTNGFKVVNCVYTGLPYVYDGAISYWTGQAGNPATLTREHTYAQSWMPSNTGQASWPNAPNGKEYPEFNDMHHLYPAHQQNANSRRSNNPFGVVVNATYTSPTGVGKLGANSGGTTVYEPRDEHKGDAARALMYMATCYNLVNGLDWSFPTNQSPAVLMQWHQQDPPSDLEIARHEFIASHQKNRNPFIDNPDWALNINFANMTYLPTAVSKIDFRKAVATWPNPSADRVNVDATLLFQPSMKYEWVGTDGVVKGEGALQAPITQLQLPEAKGVYFLRLFSAEGVNVTRVVKD
jgi:hypothetical protein